LAIRLSNASWLAGAVEEVIRGRAKEEENRIEGVKGLKILIG
jgi:hypothetical protein